MSIHIRNPGATIAAAATSSFRTQTTISTKFVRVVNGSATALCYVNAGGSTVVATSTNASLAPLEARNFERDPNNDIYVAVLLSASTGFVGVMPVNEDNL